MDAICQTEMTCIFTVVCTKQSQLLMSNYAHVSCYVQLLVITCQKAVPSFKNFQLPRFYSVAYSCFFLVSGLIAYIIVVYCGYKTYTHVKRSECVTKTKVLRQRLTTMMLLQVRSSVVQKSRADIHTLNSTEGKVFFFKMSERTRVNERDMKGATVIARLKSAIKGLPTPNLASMPFLS